MNPINITREDFPESTKTVAGMRIITPRPDHTDMELLEDVVYLKRGDQALHLQLLLPSDRTRRWPLIVHIPGSAFRRQQVKRGIGNVAHLAAMGYAVAILEYRGSEDASFPSVVLDAKAGIAFMRENADKYAVDPERVFVMGDSSGGYTALMAGLTCGVESLEDTFSQGRDYSVRGIIDFYGPTDFTTMNDEPSTQDHFTPDSPEGMFIGGRPVDPASEIVQRTIIKNYVTDGRDLPPVLMFHGSADELVPFSQSCEFYEALTQARHEADFYQVKGAHHGGGEFWSSDVLSLVDAFIRRHS